jgi:hypothetical protein
MIEKYVLSNCNGLENIALHLARRFAKEENLSDYTQAGNALIYNFGTDVAFSVFASPDHKQVTIRRMT